MDSTTFGARLELALKALSITRARLAADLSVDKSLVGRWISGSVKPSAHNLARLTQHIAGRRPGFTMLDWEGDAAAFAVKLGVEEAAAASPGPAGFLPDAVMQEALALTALRGAAYEGFWRTTRPSNQHPGGYVRDQILIRKADNGLMILKLGVDDMRFEGWTFPTQTQLFTFAADPVTGVFLFSIFNAVLRHRAEVLDGLTLTLQRNAGGTPVAAACILERTGELTGDVAADDAEFERLVTTSNPILDDGAVPQEIKDHLFVDIGPAALAAGGQALLTMAFANSLSRGPASTMPAGPPRK